ncbi:MAG: hypothetical protein JNM14_16510 [Ferruginibacter sp.]|nr:hypothetical protein [Ferruginibacter sp.]
MLFSIKLKDNLYTICYAASIAERLFFDVKSLDGNWRNLKHTELKPLFRIYAGKAMNLLVYEKLNIADYTFDSDNNENLWIRPGTNIGAGFVFKGGDLVKVLPDQDYFNAPVIKKHLTVPEDKALIEKYELVNMWGADDLKERLIRYFEKGINRDDLKFEVFPGLWNDREELRPLTCRLPVPLR